MAFSIFILSYCRGNTYELHYCYEGVRIPLYASLLFPTWVIIVLRLWAAWKHFNGSWNLELASALLVLCTGLACVVFVVLLLCAFEAQLVDGINVRNPLRQVFGLPDAL
jgi:hypothetical protein